VLDCLLANPAVTFDGHASLLPFVYRFESYNDCIWVAKDDRMPLSAASLDSSSYGSVLTLTISLRLSTITVLNPVSKRVAKNTAKDGGPK